MDVRPMVSVEASPFVLRLLGRRRLLGRPFPPQWPPGHTHGPLLLPPLNKHSCAASALTLRGRASSRVERLGCVHVARLIPAGVGVRFAASPPVASGQIAFID